MFHWYKDAVSTVGAISVVKIRTHSSSAFVGQDAGHFNARRHVLELLRSSDPAKIMAGFDLLQGSRPDGQILGQNQSAKSELSLMHCGKTFDREEIDRIISAAVDRLSADPNALSAILARSYTRFSQGDHQFEGLTNCGKYALKALSGRANDVEDKTALAYIAAYSENSADRLIAVRKLNSSAFQL